MRITQLINELDNPVAHHFVITKRAGTSYLQSYDSIVCKVVEGGTTTFGADWDYSRTTLRHLKGFIDGNKTTKELQHLVDVGLIEVNNNLKEEILK